MSRIIFVPIERLEQRYTGMMYDALAPHCDLTIEGIGGIMPRQIKKGQFLDITNTISHKASQLIQIADLFDADLIQDGDIFLVGDIFFPGLESIKYMAELLGINVKIAAFNYAGRADETDFVRQLGAWSDHSEKGWHDACDLILVGSDYHRQRVVSYFKLPEHKVRSTGYVWSPEWVENVRPKRMTAKKDYVIWPHRICPEKGDDILFRYALQTSRNIVITTCGKKDPRWDQFSTMENVTYLYGLTKKQYYDYMANAEYYLSTARQETFGYTLQEALYYGCKVLAPNKACYAEFLPMQNLWMQEDELDLAFKALNYLPTPQCQANNVDLILTLVHSLGN